MPPGAAQRRQKSARRSPARSHWTQMRGDRGGDREGGIDRREPVGLDAGVQRVPDEIGHDGPEHRIDQHPRGERAGIAPGKRVKPHRAEDEHQRRRERDLGRNQFGDEGRPEILDPGAAHLLDEGHPVVIGIPEDDRRKQRQRNEPAEIRPGREQPAPQFGNADEPDQDRRAEKQRGVFRHQRRTDRGADREPPSRRARSPAPWRGRTAQSSRPPAAAHPASRSWCRPPPSG